MMYLYETHIPVTNTEKSRSFYMDIVGLMFAYRDPMRDIVFLWIGDDRRSMLGLWGPGTKYGNASQKCHLAIAVSLPELLNNARRLNDLGIQTRDFTGKEIAEPSVIGWMPSAQIYFQDPDGHTLEFIALLEDAPVSGFIGSLAQWREQKTVIKTS